MLDIGFDKILVVLVVALVVLGPGRLGEAARGLGRARAQLRRFTAELPPEATKVIRDPRRALFDAVADERRVFTDAAAAVRESVSPPAEEERRKDTP